MKPFDLQASKDGAELVTREGKPARILCYDFLRYEQKTKSSYREILTAIIDQDEKGTKFEMFACHETSGKATMVIPAMGIECEEKKYDLFIKGKKRQGYVEIYRNTKSAKDDDRVVRGIVYDKIEIAKALCDSNSDFIGLAKIEWEE